MDGRFLNDKAVAGMMLLPATLGTTVAVWCRSGVEVSGALSLPLVAGELTPIAIKWRIPKRTTCLLKTDHSRQKGPAPLVLQRTEQPIDTGTAAGKCFLDMLGVFAEFETNLRRGRQLEGIAKAKAAGVYKGRPASIDAAQVRELKAQGLGGH